MNRQLITGTVRLAAIAMVMTTDVAYGQILFSENFDGLAGSLGPSVNERTGNSRVTLRAADAGTSVPIPNAFTHSVPGWTIDSTTYNAYGASVGNVGVPLLGDPNYGVDEWEGWSVANKDFWVYVAGDQDRSLFTKASGNVAVADGDEWDDLRKDAGGADIPRQGFMNSEIKTSNINVSAYQGQMLTLTFDSSWDDEAFDDTHVNPAFNSLNNQGAIVAASFDGAPANNDTFVDFWDSNSGGSFFKDGDASGKLAKNETITKSFVVPAGATNVQLKLGYYNAANDWWWAVDNLVLKDATSNTVWSDNFDTVPLGPSVNERNQPGGHVTAVATAPNTNPKPNAFTHTAPAGWNVNNSGGVPGIGDPNQGVEEWEGWSFTNSSFWLFVKDSGRSQFTKASGIFAVADPDNWDALGDPESLGTYNSLLETPPINITGVGAGLLQLAFDSSWLPEDTQTAIVEADYGNGFVEILRWESDENSAFYHIDNPNESVLLSLANPAGASSLKLRWGMVNATDDWWWGLDNIKVSAVPEPSSVVLLAMAGLVLGGIRRRSQDGRSGLSL